MKKAFVLFLVFFFFVVGTSTLAASPDEEAQPEDREGGAMMAKPEIVLIQDRFTWAKNWLEAPTASDLGIAEFNEAPMLAAMVARGELPPVAERLPDDPLVIGPYEEIGEYGGELRVARQGPNDYGDMVRGAHGFLFREDPTTNEVIPSLAKGYEAPSDNRSLTIYLREGAKWSDGMPFTADDIMFYYAYAMADPDVRDWTAGAWTFAGELSEFEKIDDYAVRINFPAPVSPAVLKGNLTWFRTRQSFLFTAAHWAKNYHEAFNPDVDELAEEEGYDSWPSLFKAAINTQPNQQFVQPEITTWIMESRDSRGKLKVRNPYYWAVDPAGNQLPYIDSMYVEFFTNMETAVLSMMQGSIDIGGGLLNVADFQLYKENEGIGNYTVREWPDLKTGWLIYCFNLDHEDPVKGPIFHDDRFRQAMSLAINREEINEFVFQGLGTPQQFTVSSGVEFYDPAWARAYADYDPERAKRLLSEMGLRDVDGDGLLEGLGGEPFEVDLFVRPASQYGITGYDTSKLVRDYWEDVGIKTNYGEMSTELFMQNKQANRLDVELAYCRSYMPTRLILPHNFSPVGTGLAERWALWIGHQRWVEGGRIGEEPALGVEPPEKWQRYLGLHDEWGYALSDAESNRLGREYWSLHAELVPTIGVIGLVQRPVIINNRIHNVPESLPLSWESTNWEIATPAQWFIRE